MQLTMWLVPLMSILGLVLVGLSIKKFNNRFNLFVEGIAFLYVAGIFLLDSLVSIKDAINLAYSYMTLLFGFLGSLFLIVAWITKAYKNFILQDWVSAAALGIMAELIALSFKYPNLAMSDYVILGFTLIIQFLVVGYVKFKK